MKIALKQLSEQSGVAARTIRFYIQRGLLAPPIGETRNAHYTEAHLADLLRVRAWQDAGLSLDAISDLLQAKADTPIAAMRPGSIEVRSHLVLADGLELMVAPERAGLTQAQIRRLFLEIQKTYTNVRNATPTHDKEVNSDE